MAARCRRAAHHLSNGLLSQMDAQQMATDARGLKPGPVRGSADQCVRPCGLCAEAFSAVAQVQQHLAHHPDVSDLDQH